MFPETSGRTLEELRFCKCANVLWVTYFMDTSTVYEDEQEALRHSGVEVLRRHGTAETYGTMEDSSRRTVRPDEQG